MPSSSTRLELVQRAVKLGGRSAELHAEAKEWLNDLLRHLAITHRYKVLKKVGSELTLNAGSSTIAWPDDMGAGCDRLLFGIEKTPIDELDLDDFVDDRGFPASGASNGRPTKYFFDREARLFRFNGVADRAYPVIPIYYKLPEAYSVSSSDDNTKIWYESDAAIVEGLVWKVFHYVGDQREFNQETRFNKFDAEYRRGTQPTQGGVTRVRLSKARFTR